MIGIEIEIISMTTVMLTGGVFFTLFNVSRGWQQLEDKTGTVSANTHSTFIDGEGWISRLCLDWTPTLVNNGRLKNKRRKKSFVRKIGGEGGCIYSDNAFSPSD